MLGILYYNGKAVSQDFGEARRLFRLATAQGNAGAQYALGHMHLVGHGGPPDLAKAKWLYGLAAAQGHAKAQASLNTLDRAAPVQRAKEQADADAMMKQLLAEDEEEKKANGAAKSTKRAKGKKARKKRGEPAVSSVDIGHELGARDAGVSFEEGSGGEPKVVLSVAPSRPLRGPLSRSHPSSEPQRQCQYQLPSEPPPLPMKGQFRLVGSRGRGRDNRGARGRGGHPLQSAAATVTGDDATGSAHLLGQASLRGPVPGSSDVGATAPAATTAAQVALDRPPPGATVMSLANAQFDTGRPEAPESTIGGQTTCIICFNKPKTHIAVPCGHWCACGDCSAQMTECPICRNAAPMWMHVHVA